MIRQLLSLLCLSALVIAGCGGAQPEMTVAPSPTATVAPTADRYISDLMSVVSYRVDTEVEAETVVETVAEEMPLAATSWDLAFFGMPDDPVTPIADTRLTVNYLIDEFTGTGGCNWFLGAFATQGNQITPDYPSLTRVQCSDPDGVMDQENTFVGALANATSFEMEGDNLVLYTVGDQRLLTLEPATPTAFEETVWSLRFMSDGTEWVPLAEGTEITLQFAGPQASGSAGCNSYTADAGVAGAGLTITDVAATETACNEPEGVMEQETAYLNALSAIGAYNQLAGALALQDSESEPMLLFSAD